MNTSGISSTQSVTDVALSPSLSAGQERLWFLENLNTHEQPFVVYSIMGSHGELDHARLRASLIRLLNDYPILGLVVTEKDGVLQAQVKDADIHSIWQHEALPDDAAVIRRIESLIQQPFDLENGPLLRIVTLKSTTEEVRWVVVAHQLILDRHSLYLFCMELATLYSHTEETSSTKRAVHPAKAGTDASHESPDWWRKQLEGVLPLEFPTDRMRPHVQSVKRQGMDRVLDAHYSEMLQAFCDERGVSVESLLLSVFVALLYRYTSTSDVIIGLASHNQPGGDARTIIGPLSNWVPLRLELDQAMPFAGLLEQVRTTSHESRSHFVPFAVLLDSVTVDRDLSRAPLVQIAFTWAGDVAAQIGDLSLTLPHVPADLFDIHLIAFAQDAQVHLRIEYDAALFEQETIERIAEHYQILLGGALADSAASILALPIMSAQERETVLKTWNQTWVDFPSDQCVHHLVEAQVARTPDRIAVVFGDEQLTYAELNQRANQLAHYLQSLGVQPDDLVGVHVPRSIDMLVAVLAVHKAGAADVPLDPHFPQDRLNLIVEIARVKVLITHSTILDHTPGHGAETVIIDQCPLEDFSTKNPVSAVQPHHLMHAIFTSGSTGRPKGVLLEHRSVVNFLTSMKAKPGMDEDESLLAVTTLSFDIALMELFLPLIVGARVVIASYEDAMDGYRLIQLVNRYDITFMQATPVSWRMMMEAGWKGSPKMTVVSGGEVLQPELAQQIIERSKILWNQYGPTETTVYSTQGPVLDIKDFISIGYPVNNTTIYILDPRGEPTPIGVPGELTIGGDGLAREYLGQPDLTAEKFVPDLFVGREGARMYRTGDIARYRADGRLQFYGRLDHQVKIRGFRIELGEIETALSKHPNIKQNVVVVREDDPGNKYLAAYLVSQDGIEIKSSELRELLRTTLPAYMIPSLFVRLDAMPLTPNGKINRRALPKPDMAEVKSEAEYVAPRNKIEERVAQIWAEALKLPQVSMNDNFFEMGGHSLLAIRIFNRIEKEFGRVLPLAILFEAPTAGQFAALLADDGAASAVKNLHPALVPIQPRGSLIPIFCVGGGVINLNNLARQLSPNQPFYALQWAGLDRTHILDMTLEEAAASFIEAIRTIQPHGPYCLAGSFTAGMVTVEMARQLSASGEEIGLLLGFDTVNSAAAYAANPAYAAKRHRSVIRKFLGVVRKGPVVFWQHVTNPVYREKLQHYVWKAAIKVLTTFKRPIPLWLRSGIYEEFFILRSIERHTIPYPYQGSFRIYLTPRLYAKYEPLPKFGWAEWVAGEVIVFETPGEPCWIMLSPYVEHLGNKVRGWLENEQARISPQG